jgi:MoxR-like ATPase
MEPLADPAAVAELLRSTGYLSDDALATVAWLALDLQRPLLLEGEPGTGKTASPRRSPKGSGSR